MKTQSTKHADKKTATKEQVSSPHANVNCGTFSPSQRGLRHYCKRHWKLIAITLGLSLLVLWVASLLNPTTAQLGATKVITPVAMWVESHRLLFLLWHILLIGAIYGLWGYKVNSAVKRGILSAKEAVFVREIRWLLIACLIAIDYFLLR